MQAILHLHEKTGPIDPEGWFHAGQLATYLKVTNSGLKLHEGGSHEGFTGASWTESIQQQRHYGIECAILMLRPTRDQLDNHRAKTHAVAAVKLSLDHSPNSWYLLDSVTPTRLYDLTDPQCYSKLDADIMYTTLADRVQFGDELVATRRQIRDRMMQAHTRNSQATCANATNLEPSSAWPGAARTEADNFVRDTCQIQL